VETVLKWVNQADIDAGERHGTRTEDNAKIHLLEQEVREPLRKSSGGVCSGGRDPHAGAMSRLP
jgi:hypothetical protein